MDLSNNTLEPILSYPNPFSSEVTIQLPDANVSAIIQVYNGMGILVAEESVIGVYKFGNQLSSGIYFVKINMDSKTETVKVIKEQLKHCFL